MNIQGRRNALNGVENGCRTNAMRRFLTVKVQICLRKSRILEAYCRRSVRGGRNVRNLVIDINRRQRFGSRIVVSERGLWRKAVTAGREWL